MQDDETNRNCTLVEENADGYIYKFSCKEYNPMFASLTLLFIYLPSLNVLATLYGPKKAGALGIVWGAVMLGFGGIFLFVVNVSNTDSWYVMGGFLVCLSGGMLILGPIMAARTGKSPDST